MSLMHGLDGTSWKCCRLCNGACNLQRIHWRRLRSNSRAIQMLRCEPSLHVRHLMPFRNMIADETSGVYLTLEAPNTQYKDHSNLFGRQPYPDFCGLTPDSCLLGPVAASFEPVACAIFFFTTTTCLLGLPFHW